MKISVWYHTRLFGGNPKINPDYAISLMMEQMKTYRGSGLHDAADELVICSNGGTENVIAARACAPKTKTRFIDNGEIAESHLPTVAKLRQWLPGHEDWYVCYWHIKGVTHPGNDMYNAWRQCMERCVILNWSQCVNDLEAGFDTVGAHWLTKEKYGNSVTFPFWGGMFFWAKASFLKELPELPLLPSKRQDWFLSENWIGMGRTPKIKDYAPHWPSLSDCTATRIFCPKNASVTREIPRAFKAELESFGKAFNNRRAATWLDTAGFISECPDCNLVETGCYYGEPVTGGGTVLLAHLAKAFNGKLDAYELNPAHIKLAKQELSRRSLAPFVSFHEGDSVKNIACRDSKITLAYLDSFDCGEGPDFAPCQEHQLAELNAVLPLMNPKSAILLDDKISVLGKTVLTEKQLETEPFRMANSGYQVLYVSENAHKLMPGEICVLTGHLANYAPLAADTVYRNKPLFALRHNYRIKVMRHYAPEFYEPGNKYFGFSWARLAYMLRLVESNLFKWVWCVGCDTLVTNFNIKLESVTSQALPEHHVLMAGEAVAPLQADSFLVRSSREGAEFLKRILSLRQKYKNHPWVDNQAMIDEMPRFNHLIKIIPQYQLNAFDYTLFYGLGDIYKKGMDCYGNRGQWQPGDFLIHWPAQNLETRLGLVKQFLPKVVR